MSDAHQDIAVLQVLLFAFPPPLYFELNKVLGFSVSLILIMYWKCDNKNHLTKNRLAPECPGKAYYPRGWCHPPRRPWLVGGCLLLIPPHRLTSMSMWIPVSPSCVDTSNTEVGPSEWPYSTLVASLKTPLQARETAPSVKCMPCKSRTRVQPPEPTFKKSQVGWCVLVIPVFGKQRHMGPWGLPAI